MAIGVNEAIHSGPIELPNYRFKQLLDRGGMGAVSYTHLTLPTNREV